MIEVMLRFSSLKVNGIYEVEKDYSDKVSPYIVYVTKNYIRGHNGVSEKSEVSRFSTFRDTMEYLTKLYPAE